jgi:hypothetical protein
MTTVVAVEVRRIRVEPIDPTGFFPDQRRGSSDGKWTSSYTGEQGNRRGSMPFHTETYDTGIGRNLDFYA